MAKNGDILVSKQLAAYEHQKIKDKNKPIPRGDRVSVPNHLFDKFRSADNDWKGPNVHFGLILSGEKLIDNKSFLDNLLLLEPEAIGGEMEGAGLYAAANDAKADWIIVKAICRLGRGNKNYDTQALAAQNAATFALHVINKEIFFR